MELKKLLPPVLIDFIKKNSKVTRYKSYEEALLHCSTDAYQNQELCDVIADKTLSYIDTLKKRPFKLNPTTVYLAFALNYFANVYGKRSITVLDFGGACGAHYYEVKNIFPETVLVNWLVIETESMIRSAIARGIANNELSFKSEVRDITVPVDFIYSSSSLQYVQAPYEMLDKLIALRAKMILFNRMMFNRNNEDIITIQRSLLSANGQGELPAGYEDKSIRYPHFTMSFDKMNSIMTGKGYQFLSEFEEPSGRFSLGKEDIIGKGLLYVDRSQA